jgi:hypothetical protein
VIATLAIWELKPSPRAPGAAPVVTKAVAPAAAVAPPPAVTPPPIVTPPSPAVGAKPAARAELTRAAHAKPHRSSADAVRDITAKAGAQHEPAAPPEKAAPSTPAELKNPFGNP